MITLLILSFGAQGYSASPFSSLTTQTIVADQNETPLGLSFNSLRDLLVSQAGASTMNGVLHLEGIPADAIHVFIDGCYLGPLKEIEHDFALPVTAIQEIRLGHNQSPTDQFFRQGLRLELITENPTGKVFFNTRMFGDLTHENAFPGTKELSVTLGGKPIKRLTLLAAFEGLETPDISPSSGKHYSMDRHKFEIDWSKLTFTQSPNGYQDVGGELWVDGQLLADGINTRDYMLSSIIDEQIKSRFSDDYPLIIDQMGSLGNRIFSTHYGLSELKGTRGIQNNTPFSSQLGYGIAIWSGVKTHIQMGVRAKNSAERLYIHQWSLLNSDHFPRESKSQTTLFGNLETALSPGVILHIGLTAKTVTSELADHHFGDDLWRYGSPDEVYPYHPALGSNLLVPEETMGFVPLGYVWNHYSWTQTQSIHASAGLRGQVSNHSLKLQVAMDRLNYKHYSLLNPVGLAKYFTPETPSELTPEQEYIVYRNAGTRNIGTDIKGAINEAGLEYQAPGSPVEVRAFIGDQISTSKTLINLGIEAHYFDPHTEAPADWEQLSMNSGRIDRLASQYQPVQPSTTYHPHVSLCEKVGEQTELYLDYHTSSKAPAPQEIYLSDAIFAHTITSGTSVVLANGKLKPELSRHTKLGFKWSQNDHAYAHTYLYLNERRLIPGWKNYYNAYIDGAEFVWAQIVNKDQLRNMGLVLEYIFRPFDLCQSKSTLNLSVAKPEKLEGDSYYLYGRTDYYGVKDHAQMEINNRLQVDLPRFDKTTMTLYHRYSLATMFKTRGVDGVSIVNAFNPLKNKENDRTVATNILDLDLSSRIQIKNLDVSLSLSVNNLFDASILNQMYGEGGNMSQDYSLGWLETAPGRSWIEEYPERFELVMAFFQNPDFFEPPRMLKLGIQITM